MKKWNVSLMAWETWETKEEIEADTKEEAIAIASDLWREDNQNFRKDGNLGIDTESFEAWEECS